MRTTCYIALTAALFLSACGDDGDNAPLSAGVSSSGGTTSGGTTQPAVDVDQGNDTGSTGATTTGHRTGDITVANFPSSRIISGGVPKDGIPALTNPSFVGADAVTYLSDDDLVLGLVINGEVKAYPHNIGWWHEIVNDRIGGQAVSVTFCPLTGTGLAFNAEDENGQFELGVSGLLYNNNLIMYDRRDNSTLYPQLLFTGIEGPRLGERLEQIPVTETTWATWKTLYPDTQVVAGGTYSTSRYVRYPYVSSRLGDYRTSNSYLLFSLDPALGNNSNVFSTIYEVKDRVLGVRINERSKAYHFNSMGEQIVINDLVGGEEIVVLRDRAADLTLSYSRVVDGRTLGFEIETEIDGPFFGLRDVETGTLWDISGRAFEGELAGQQLRQIPAYSSMWFAWVSFWQDTEVWQQ